VGQLAVATFLSVFFSALELLLWKLDLTADHERTFGMLCMPAPAPGQPNPAIAHGATGGDAEPASSADTPLLALGGAHPGPNGKQKRPAERIRIYVTDPEKARSLAEGVLSQTTKRFKHKKTSSKGNDQYVLEYELRARKKSPTGLIIERMYADCTPFVIAAETVKES